jgi:hypothetical protein
MALFRTMQRLVPWLVGLFLLAQFAGVVPRLAYAQPGAKAMAAHQHHQHAHDRADHNKTQHQHPADQHGNIADQCCALHLLNGVLAFVVSASPIELSSQQVSAVPTTDVVGINASPLDRPPRSLLSL